MNNDELQKAIDDITNSNAAAEAAPVADATAENEQLASELAGAAEAPAAAATAEFAPTPAPAPEVPAEPGMPPVAEAPAAETVAPEMAEAVAPATEATAAAEVKLSNVPMIDVTPAAAATEAAPKSDNATLEEAMKELYPLLDKVDMPLDEKFDITMKYGEPAKALELAKQIADDTSKANALMKIIEKLK